MLNQHEKLPLVDTPPMEANSTSHSDRVKALVVRAGDLDSGGLQFSIIQQEGQNIPPTEQQHLALTSAEEKTAKVVLTRLEDEDSSRKSSLEVSVSAQGGAQKGPTTSLIRPSIFKDQRSYSLPNVNEVSLDDEGKKEENVERYLQELKKYNRACIEMNAKMKGDITKMSDSIKVQKNCNMIVKNGIAQFEKYLARLKTIFELQQEKLNIAHGKERLDTPIQETSNTLIKKGKKRARTLSQSSPGKENTKKRPLEETSPKVPLKKTFANVVTSPQKAKNQEGETVASGEQLTPMEVVTSTPPPDDDDFVPVKSAGQKKKEKKKKKKEFERKEAEARKNQEQEKMELQKQQQQQQQQQQKQQQQQQPQQKQQKKKQKQQQKQQQQQQKQQNQQQVADQRQGAENKRRKKTTPQTKEGDGEPSSEAAKKGRRKKRRKRRIRIPKRKEALIIKPPEGKSYATALLEIKRGVQLKDSGTEVHRIQETQDGSVLIELSSSKDRQKLLDAVKTVAGPESTVRELIPYLTVEIRGLDGTTGKEEVRQVVKEATKLQIDGDIKVAIFKAKGTKADMAVVELPEAAALKLTNKGRLNNGWSNWKVRLRAEVPRCFKCLGFGHSQWSCKGTDRKSACFKCGGQGHKSGECPVEKAECFLCKERTDKAKTDHLPGSGACKCYREALKARKTKCHR